MTRDYPPVRRKALAGLLMACLLLTQSAVSHAGLFGLGNGTQKPAVRDFLPPVASINPRLDEHASQNADNAIEPVVLSAVTSPTIHTTPKVERLAGELSNQLKSQQMQTVIEIQRQVDEADLEYLWQATVEKNPVIRFSLEKLATPPDLQTKQSSNFLTKTLSVLISGAAMGSTMLPGGGAYRDMGTMAVGNALQNLVEGRTAPTPGSLSATEQIQLAGLIDELKMKLIHTYQDYKNTLQSLADSHAVTIKNNNLYSKALASKNDMAIMAAGTAYYQALVNETALRQKAKLYRLELERLAGREAVSDLTLAVHLETPNATQTAAQTDASPEPVAAESTTASSEKATPSPSEVGPPEPAMGPEPPPKRKGLFKSEAPAADENVATLAMPLDLAEPMELGPSLLPDRPVSPLPALPAVNNSPASSSQTASNTNSPLAASPDRISDPWKPQDRPGGGTRP